MQSKLVSCIWSINSMLCSCVRSIKWKLCLHTWTAISFSLWSFSIRNLHFINSRIWKLVLQTVNSPTIAHCTTCSATCWLVCPNIPWLIFNWSNSLSRLLSTSSLSNSQSSLLTWLSLTWSSHTPVSQSCRSCTAVWCWLVRNMTWPHCPLVFSGWMLPLFHPSIEQACYQVLPARTQHLQLLVVVWHQPWISLEYVFPWCFVDYFCFILINSDLCIINQSFCFL